MDLDCRMEDLLKSWSYLKYNAAAKENAYLWKSVVFYQANVSSSTNCAYTDMYVHVKNKVNVKVFTSTFSPCW